MRWSEIFKPRISQIGTIENEFVNIRVIRGSK